MKSNLPVRCGPGFALIVAGMVAAAAVTTIVHAQQQSTGPIERIRAISENVTGAGGSFQISLLRWSTDDERQELLAVLSEKDETAFQELLESGPTLGYFWTTESAGYPVRYAYRSPMPGGGERLVFATDRRLGAWDFRVWKPLEHVQSTDYPFTIVELRLNSNGEGEGKVSLAASVTVDQDAQTIALENYETVPVMLKDVKRGDL